MIVHDEDPVLSLKIYRPLRKPDIQSTIKLIKIALLSYVPAFPFTSCLQPE